VTCRCKTDRKQASWQGTLASTEDFLFLRLSFSYSDVTIAQALGFVLCHRRTLSHSLLCYGKVRLICLNPDFLSARKCPSSAALPNLSSVVCPPHLLICDMYSSEGVELAFIAQESLLYLFTSHLHHSPLEFILYYLAHHFLAFIQFMSVTPTPHFSLVWRLVAHSRSGSLVYPVSGLGSFFGFARIPCFWGSLVRLVFGLAIRLACLPQFSGSLSGQPTHPFSG
jgi:hypothetical protein